MKNCLHKIIFVFLCGITSLLGMFIYFCLVSTVLILSLILFARVTGELETEEMMTALGIVGFSASVAFITTPLGLIPSYKITILLEKLLEKQGWKIENPGRLFLLSLLLLLILFLGLTQLLT